MKKDEVLKILNRRYSCRDFDKNKKISDDDFEVILESGRLAPSSLGLEPWKFIVIKNESLKQQIAKDASGNETKIQDCSHLVIICHLKSEVLKPESAYIKNLYDPSHLASMQSMLASIRENRYKNDEKAIDAYAREQCFIAIGQMTQSAAMLDVDSCIIGGFYARGVKTHLNAFINVDDLEPACLIAFGYGKTDLYPSKHRKSYEDCIKFL